MFSCGIAPCFNGLCASRLLFCSKHPDRTGALGTVHLEKPFSVGSGFVRVRACETTVLARVLSMFLHTSEVDLSELFLVFRISSLPHSAQHPTFGRKLFPFFRLHVADREISRIFLLGRFECFSVVDFVASTLPYAQDLNVGMFEGVFHASASCFGQGSTMNFVFGTCFALMI